jgi:hypothetical protein
VQRGRAVRLQYRRGTKLRSHACPRVPLTIRDTRRRFFVTGSRSSSSMSMRHFPTPRPPVPLVPISRSVIRIALSMTSVTRGNTFGSANTGICSELNRMVERKGRAFKFKMRTGTPERVPDCSYWSGRPDSNRRPQPWQGCALPTEPRPQWSFYLSTPENRAEARWPKSFRQHVLPAIWTKTCQNVRSRTDTPSPTNYFFAGFFDTDFFAGFLGTEPFAGPAGVAIASNSSSTPSFT